VVREGGGGLTFKEDVHLSTFLRGGLGNGEGEKNEEVGLPVQIREKNL